MPPAWPARFDRISAKFHEEMNLAQLRTAHRLSQASLGQSLHVDLSVIANMETSTDMYIRTLRRFIEATGGELEIDARFPDH